MTNFLTKAVVNGRLIPLSEATISLGHPIFLNSLGVYEAIQVDQGRPFRLEDHLERLYTSARLLQIAIPYPLSTLQGWATTLLQALPPEKYSLQILVLGQTTSETGFTIAFLPKPLNTYPPRLYTAGARAITYPGERLLPQCKSMNTLLNHLARTAAHEQGALEALLTHQGQLYEGTRSNLFVVQAQTKALLTPPAALVLSGVTREIVIALMAPTAHPVAEAEIFLDTPISEIFITSTSMHVMPVTHLNGQPVGDGVVGPVTQLAMERFEAYYRDSLADGVSG